MADDFGLKIGIEGEREFKAALKDMSAAMRRKFFWMLRRRSINT